MSERALGAMLLLSAIVAGCGSSSSNGSNAAIAFEDLPAKYAAAACTAYQNCVGPIFSLS